MILKSIIMGLYTTWTVEIQIPRYRCGLFALNIHLRYHKII